MAKRSKIEKDSTNKIEEKENIVEDNIIDQQNTTEEINEDVEIVEQEPVSKLPQINIRFNR